MELVVYCRRNSEDCWVLNSAVLGPVAEHGCLVCEELLAIEGASWTLNLMGGPYRSFSVT